ncbi:SAVED domain-containing protein [Myxococcus stipitatus]|uniref:SAVED domain-containing protein n=1 Tax=Myxococcus stipitatus TaxID=83455 RepID=UPI003145146A
MISPTTPGGYDPVTLVHWLWWKLRCHEGSAEDFQKLFENVIKRAQPEFMQIRPYGNIGDRKCDGLFFEEGVVFQVYSPDELKQSEVQAKIEEDIAGAVGHWGDKGLRRWTFVYNCRRGLAPDIPATLKAQQAKYPNVMLDHMSSDALWEKARGLSVQQRSEILGAPFGYEHLFLLPDGTAGDAADKIRRGQFVVVHDVMSPINLQAAVSAMSPDVPLGPALHIRPSGSTWKGGLPDEWRAAAEQQRLIVREAIEKSRDLLPRFAVFSLAPVALAAHLGFLFSDRVEVRAFQFDRERSEWSWPSNEDNESVQVATTGIPAATVNDACEVTLRLSISARVPETDAQAGAPGAAHHVEIHVPEPSKTWLCSGARLRAAAKQIHDTLAALRDRFPECTRVHVFAAVPTPVAIALGQAVNPRMDPPVALYEYSRQRSPRYRYALTLEEAS